jgi:peptidoglycan lytic transglycosylase
MKRLIAVLFVSLTPIASLVASGPPEVPEFSARHTVQYGLASWYGWRFQDLPTASGTPFNERALTAAHLTLPLGSKVKVTNLKNGRSVVVKINDRGPHVRGRIIDLSKAAARRIGFVRRGITPVKIAVLKRGGETHSEMRGRVDLRARSRMGNSEAKRRREHQRRKVGRGATRKSDIEPQVNGNHHRQH